MIYRRADEPLVCSDKTWQVSSNLHYYVQKQSTTSESSIDELSFYRFKIKVVQ
jgi:hypothetical protein